MPDFKKPWDPYNNFNNIDNFNAHEVKVITAEIMANYFPYPTCFFCKLQFENPLRVCFGQPECKLRIKDKTKPTFVQTKGYHKGDDKSLCVTLRTGQMAWNFYHELPIIFRASNETATVLHHKDLNPYNNHWSNIAVVDTHEKHHGMLKSFDSIFVELIKESENIMDNKNMNRQIEKLKNVYDYLLDIPDTPRVFKIVDIFDNFIKGNITEQEAQKRLETINACLPEEFLKKYDMRKIKYNNQHILEYERRVQENAVQEISQLAI